MKRKFKILLSVVLMTFGGLILYSLIIMVQSMTATPNVENNWLSTLNSYRQSSGVNPVKENLRYTLASQHHADYLAMTATDFQVGKYQNLHKENPESPYFSRDGATLGAGVISWTEGKYASAVDQLMAAPFHAIGMLRENLSEVGFGTAIAGEKAYSPNTRVTNISVLSGLRNRPRSKVIFFPGPNSTTHLNSFPGENPEPREACGTSFKNFYGLPIFASLLHRPSENLTARIQQPNGKTLARGSDLCIVTEKNFVSTDATYGPAGKSIIRSENLVLIIPKSPLAEGRYEVEIEEPGRPLVKWSFTYKAPELKF